MEPLSSAFVVCPLANLYNKRSFPKLIVIVECFVFFFLCVCVIKMGLFAVC